MERLDDQDDGTVLHAMTRLVRAMEDGYLQLLRAGDHEQAARYERWLEDVAEAMPQVPLRRELLAPGRPH